MRFRDKICIITGAGQGIGRIFAQKFAEEGARVVVAESNEEGGKKTADEITSKGYEAWFIKTDVSDEASAEAMAKGTVNKYGRIDILINNAAVFASLGFTHLYKSQSQKILKYSFCSYIILHSLTYIFRSIINLI